MAILNGGIQFTGSIGGLSAYKMKGSDKIILRRANPPDRKKILTRPEYERTRENSSEFSLCAYATAAIRAAMRPVLHLGDYNFTSFLNKIAKLVQLNDTNADRGLRSVLISQNQSLYNGFNLNSVHTFDSMLHQQVMYTIDRTLQTTTINLPALVPGVNFFLPWPVPQFRIIVSCGLVADQLYQRRHEKSYQKVLIPFVHDSTEWLAANQQHPARRFVLPHDPRPHDYSYVVSIGIEMEIIQLRGVGGVAKVGAAKILGLG